MRLARLQLLIDRVCEWYCDRFGTETAFAVSLALFVVWITLIPILGYERWNTGPGLLGNTIESTGEWFFAIATLVLARKINQRQREQQEHMARQIAHMEAILERLGPRAGAGPAATDGD